MRFASRAFVPALLLSLALGVSTGAYAAKNVTGSLIGSDGKSHGTITVTEAPRGVLLRIEAHDLPAGWHGMHFHEHGVCAPPKFTSSGGHVHASTPVIHGFLTPDATDLGDLPNLYVNKDGTATVELYSALVSLNTAGNRPALLDADGSALIIHVNPDDYTTQPIGGAGSRLACAIIK